MSPRRRRLRWGSPAPSRPAHPIRDSAIVYGALAVLVVVFAAATGGPVGRAAILAAFVFLVALGWSVRRWRRHPGAGEGER